jgi:hypothetical protein
MKPDDEPLRVLEEQMREFRVKYPADADWRKNDPKMEVWQAMHVYDWLKMHKEKELSVFADAIGRQSLTGQQLIDLIQNEDEACKNAILLANGDALAIRFFCGRVKKEKGVIDLNQKKGQDDGIPIIAREDIQMQTRRAGRGGFGVIYMGSYQGQEVAIKTLIEPKSATSDGKEKPPESELWRDIEREARMLQVAMSPNVVPLVGVNKTEKDPFLVTQYMPCGTVEEEYQKSRNGDAASIFHRSHPQNTDPNGPFIQKNPNCFSRSFYSCSFPFFTEAYHPSGYCCKKCIT